MKRSGPQRRRGSQPATGRQRTRFLVDAMHGSLARKLRAFGFDASYNREGGDDGILDQARRDARIILSSDRSLVARAKSKEMPAVLLKEKSDSLRLREISVGLASLGIDLKRGDSLCSLCGGELETLQRGEVEGKVPESVKRRHRLFYKCSYCGHVYWRGAHWKKLRSLARRLSASQVDTVARGRQEGRRISQKNR